VTNKVLDRMDPSVQIMLNGVVLSLSSRIGAGVAFAATAEDAVEVRIGSYDPVEIVGHSEGWTSEDDWLLYYYLLGVDRGLAMAGR